MLFAAVEFSDGAVAVVGTILIAINSALAVLYQALLKAKDSEIGELRKRCDRLEERLHHSPPPRAPKRGSDPDDFHYQSGSQI